MAAEDREREGAEGKEDVADYEVLKIKNARALAKRLERRPDIESEDAWKREEHEGDTADTAGAATTEPRVVHNTGNDILEDGEDRRKRGETHKEEEKRPPEPTERH